MIDSIKKRNVISVNELLLSYDEKGRLKNYTYMKNNKIKHNNNITYLNNEVRGFSLKDYDYDYIIKLDKHLKAIKIESIYKRNSFFNSTEEITYYSNGNFKQGGSYLYEYGKHKGIFSNINMEPWCKLLFKKLIPISLQKNNVIKEGTVNRDLDGKVYTGNKVFNYEIKDNYPSKIIYKHTSYDIIFFSFKN